MCIIYTCLLRVCSVMPTYAYICITYIIHTRSEHIQTHTPTSFQSCAYKEYDTVNGLFITCVLSQIYMNVWHRIKGQRFEYPYKFVDSAMFATTTLTLIIFKFHLSRLVVNGTTSSPGLFYPVTSIRNITIRSS